MVYLFWTCAVCPLVKALTDRVTYLSRPPRIARGSAFYLLYSDEEFGTVRTGPPNPGTDSVTSKTIGLRSLCIVVVRFFAHIAACQWLMTVYVNILHVSIINTRCTHWQVPCQKGPPLLFILEFEFFNAFSYHLFWVFVWKFLGPSDQKLN